MKLIKRVTLPSAPTASQLQVLNLPRLTWESRYRPLSVFEELRYLMVSTPLLEFNITLWMGPHPPTYLPTDHQSTEEEQSHGAAGTGASENGGNRQDSPGHHSSLLPQPKANPRCVEGLEPTSQHQEGFEVTS